MKMIERVGYGCIRNRVLMAVGVILAAFAQSGSAATAQVLRNINEVIVPESSFPAPIGVLNGRYLFGARDSEGNALWSTDGTADGTRLLRHYGQGAGAFSSPDHVNMVEIDDRAYFVAGDMTSGSELWTTDGTSVGTQLVIDSYPGPEGSGARIHGSLGAQILFTAFSRDAFHLYITDGTAAGTRALTSHVGSNEGLITSSIFVADDKVYFVTYGYQYDYQIWVSDGTLAGTRAVTNPYSGATGNSAESPLRFHRLGDLLFYQSGGYLWTIDITTDTIAAVTSEDGSPGFGPPTTGWGELIVMEGFVMFLSSGSQIASLDLWRSDGTSAGTYRVAVVHPSSADFSELQSPVFEKVGAYVVYISSNSEHGSQLWSSDGTSANTVRLTNAAKPANAAYQVAIPIGVKADRGYFTISDGANADTWSVWETDGTPEGTRTVAGLPAMDHAHAGLTRVAGEAEKIFFNTYRDAQGSISSYDPAARKVVLLREGMGFASYGHFYDGSLLYFSHTDPVIGEEPWVSDGTPGGTRLLADMHAQSMSDLGSGPHELVELDGRLYFVADDGVHGRELWVSDGTSSGTNLLVDIYPGLDSSNPNHLVAANGSLLFFASDHTGVFGGTSRLMRLDPDTGAVERLSDLAPQAAVDDPLTSACRQDEPVMMRGSVYFAAQDGWDLELWRSDGTAEGTVQVANLNRDLSSMPCSLTVWRDRIYFVAYGEDGFEPWVSDGTDTGTVQLANIEPGQASSFPRAFTAFEDALYFGAAESAHGAELWRTDGTSSGTSLAFDLAQGTASSYAIPLGVVNGRLLLGVAVQSVESPNTYEHQLWVTDGPGNATRLTDVAFDPDVDVLISGNHAYFVGGEGDEANAWVSDGTPAGTRVLRDVTSADTSGIAWFGDFHGMIVIAVAAADGEMHLWRTDATESGTVLTTSIVAQPAVAPQPYPTSRSQRLAAGQTFFFVASETLTGAELFGLSNDAPIARADTATSASGASVTIEVLTNDSDADGAIDPESVRVTVGPANGTVALASGGELVYTPTSGFSGSDSFVYTMADLQGANSNAATVTITVTAPPTPAPTTPPTTGGGKGGGGGSMRYLALLGFLALAVLRFLRVYVDRARSHSRGLSINTRTAQHEFVSQTHG